MNTTLKFALPTLLFLAFFQNLTPRGETPRKETDSFCSQAELHARKMQTDETYRQASQRLEEQLYALWNSRRANSTGPSASLCGG